MPRNPSFDPFGIRAATEIVMQETRDVAIDLDAIERVARQIVEEWGEAPAWDDTLHFQGTPEETAGWIVVLDAINFCFWAQGDDPDDRWRVTWRGTTHNGYDALAAALHRAVVDDGCPVWEAGWLRELSLETVGHMLRGDDDCPPIPLLHERMICLRDLGNPRGRPDGQPADIARDAKGSAERVAALAIERYLMFEDVAAWQRGDGRKIQVPLYKRAQILAADLSGALAGTGLAITTHLDRLTAFADYKVPQVLRQLGILRYAPDLAGHIRRLERIPVNSPKEVAIRAATVQACELLVPAILRLGRDTTASELDWRLWNLGQSLPDDAEPYHRTVTTSY